MDLFTGRKMASGISLAAPGGLEANFPLDLSVFHTKLLQVVNLEEELEAA